MRRKISERTRAQSIAICEQCYAAPMGWSGDIMRDIGASSEAHLLARKAWLSVPSGDDWLEASGILRDGWCPGDPVERL